jgi:glycosyltransferase involved in cell wall biosynthesis
MKIFITTPALSTPHGGIRIIIEWANRLSQWHEVGLYSLKQDNSNWCKLSDKVKLLKSSSMEGYECLIITSPHTIDFEKRKDTPKKVFIFAQMAEDRFSPQDKNWYNKCLRFATSKNPMFSISQWNIDYFKSQGRTTETHYIGNGVNLKDFPISHKPKDGKTVLIEGWECYNRAKDTRGIAHTVALKLKKKGYRIIAYSQFPNKTNKHIPDEYHCSPNQFKLNELYERATILIKASKFDARSCAPMEAMTKGTVTARAINSGDDDLIHGYNCLKTGYKESLLYESAITLLENESLRTELAENCYKTIEANSWDYWMEKINGILTK